MNAEERGGGKSGRKQHLHNSRFDDMRRGFIYEFWPNDLDVPRTGDSAAIGLFFEPKPFPVGAENFLRPILQSGDTAVRIRDLGFDVDAGLPVNERDRNTGVWLAKQTVALKGWRSPEVAIDCGRKLGKLMCIVHPVVRSMVERRFPSLMK